MTEDILRDILVQSPLVGILLVVGYFITKNLMNQIKDRTLTIEQKDKVITDQFVKLGELSTKNLGMMKDLSHLLDKIQENTKDTSREVINLIGVLNKSIEEQKPLLQQIINQTSKN